MGRVNVWKPKKEPEPRNEAGVKYPIMEAGCAALAARIQSLMTTEYIEVSDKDILNLFVPPQLQAMAYTAAQEFRHGIADGNQMIRAIDNGDDDYGVVQYRFRNSGAPRFLVPHNCFIDADRIRSMYREQLTQWVNHVRDLRAVLHVVSTLNETCRTFGELYALFPYVDAFGVASIDHAKLVMKVPSKPPRLDPAMKDAWRRAVRAVTRYKLVGKPEPREISGWYVTFDIDFDVPPWVRRCPGIYI